MKLIKKNITVEVTETQWETFKNLCFENRRSLKAQTELLILRFIEEQQNKATEKATISTL
jgi:hypothetical protein